MRLFKHLTLLLAAAAGGFAHGAVPQVPANADPAFVVQVGKADIINLVGYGDTDEIARTLAPLGLKPKSRRGKTLVIIGVSVDDEFVGCGCPKAFKEFSVMYEVESDASDSKLKVVPLFNTTDHPQRQLSMSTKFGTPTALGAPDHLGARGFVLKDLDGKTVFEARAAFHLPFRYLPVTMNMSLSSLGSEWEGRAFAPQLYRIAGATKVGIRLFVPGLDRWSVDPETELGRTLARIGFKPRFWQTVKVRDARSWIPSRTLEASAE